MKECENDSAFSDHNKLASKHVAKMLPKTQTKKILTTHIQVVRILIGAPDRTRTCTSGDTRS